jgi:hypothetical protein
MRFLSSLIDILGEAYAVVHRLSRRRLDNQQDFISCRNVLFNKSPGSLNPACHSGVQALRLREGM